jgi:Thioredoxin
VRSRRWRGRAAAPPEEFKSIVLGIGDGPFKGAPDARVTLVEFTDYQCPFCARHQKETVPQLLEKYVKTGKLKYVVRDFPLEAIHPARRQGGRGATLRWRWRPVLGDARAALRQPAGHGAGRSGGARPGARPGRERLPGLHGGRQVHAPSQSGAGRGCARRRSRDAILFPRHHRAQQRQDHRCCGHPRCPSVRQVPGGDRDAAGQPEVAGPRRDYGNSTMLPTRPFCMAALVGCRGLGQRQLLVDDRTLRAPPCPAAGRLVEIGERGEGAAGESVRPAIARNDREAAIAHGFPVPGTYTPEGLKLGLNLTAVPG